MKQSIKIRSVAGYIPCWCACITWTTAPTLHLCPNLPRRIANSFRNWRCSIESSQKYSLPFTWSIGGQKKRKTKRVGEQKRVETEVDLFSSQSFRNAGQTHYPHSSLLFCALYSRLFKRGSHYLCRLRKQHWRSCTEVCGALMRWGRWWFDEG